MCSSLMGPCKLHAGLSVDVWYTKIHSNGFNGSEHPTGSVFSVDAEGCILSSVAIYHYTFKFNGHLRLIKWLNTAKNMHHMEKSLK